MAKAEWANIRVKVSTRQRLSALIAVLGLDGRTAWTPELRHDGSTISLDDAINTLLDRDEAHRVRGRSSSSNRRKRNVSNNEVQGTTEI